MNHFHGRKALFILALLWLCACSEGTEIRKVYILTGQSNMTGCGNVAEFNKMTNEQQEYGNIELYNTYDGIQLYDGNKAFEYRKPLKPGNYGHTSNFGPEVGIAKVLSQRNNNANIIFVKIPWGGTVLWTNWVQDLPAYTSPPCNPYCDKVYSWFKSRLDAIMADIIDKAGTGGYSYSIQGIFWMQGEGDANVTCWTLDKDNNCICSDVDSDVKQRAQNYAANLSKFVNNVRAYIDSKNWITSKITRNSVSAVPFVYGKIRNIANPLIQGKPQWNYGVIVQSQQTKAQNLIPCVRCAEGPAHAEVYTQFPPPPDHPEYQPAHYTATGILKVGKDLGTAMVQLLDGVTTPGCWNPKDGEESILFSD